MKETEGIWHVVRDKYFEDEIAQKMAKASEMVDDFLAKLGVFEHDMTVRCALCGWHLTDKEGAALRAGVKHRKTEHPNNQPSRRRYHA